MGRKIVLTVVAVAGVAGCVFLAAVLVGQGLVRASLWAAVLAAVAGIVAVAVAVWALPRPPRALVPPELELPGWVVDRPAELAGVVNALVSGHAQTVGITTGLFGAGGFGKTTLAQMACTNRRVRRRFGGRVYLVTVGRDVRGAAAVSAKVNDVIKLVSGEDVTFTDPQLAGQHLGSLLNTGARRLLVLDDVWEAEQLAPFTMGGRRCARLVTTRVPGLLTGRGTAVHVDQMSPEQARALLAYGLPPLDPNVTDGLLAATGRWPLLLRLVNKILADAVGAADVSAQGTLLLDRLRKGGPAAIDDLRADAAHRLDVGQPQQRAQAVRATIEASTSLLDRRGKERFEELGIFAEDETIPFRLIVQLWRTTAHLDELQATQVCNRLAQLALVSQTLGPARGITVHDVVRDFIRTELGEQRLVQLNGNLLDVIAASLPSARPLSLDGSPSHLAAWWELGDNDRYLWDHLVEHLKDARRPVEAEAIAGDLRWVGARTEQFGPAAPAADLSAVGTPRSARLRATLVRVAHLLAPTEPRQAVVDVLHSRVATDPDWGPQVTALRDLYPRPRLVNRWPLPDLADPALLRVLAGHDRGVTTLAVASDGRWLASGSNDQSIRIWDTATGKERARLTGHTDAVNTVAVAPDGTWLTSGSDDGSVRIWDAATGTERATLTGHFGWVRAVAVAPDGRWLASGSNDQSVRIWDTATGTERARLTGHTHWVRAVAVAPDGSWLASGSDDQSIRIWDTATGKERARLTGHTRAVTSVAVAPDGSWLASGSDDGSVRIWDAATGTERARLTGHIGRVRAVAVAPDGSWLASCSDDQSIRIWEVATRKERARLTGRIGWVRAVALAPDGSWLASGSDDQSVRIWDAATGTERARLTGHTGWVTSVAVAPDGSWLASGSNDQSVRIWDMATGKEEAWLTGHTGWVTSVAVAPDGSWLASGSNDQAVRIWDVVTRRQRVRLTGHTRAVTSVAVAPDGRWLASGSDDQSIRIWDMATGKERASLTGHTGWVTSVAVAPDGRWLASGSTDQTVRIWDMATGKEQARLTGHTRAVTSVAVTPDGRWLASSSTDQTVRIWDAFNWRTQSLMRVERSLEGLAWLSSGTVASGGQGGLYLFDFLDNAVPEL